jgi:ATP-binding cassette subfamily B protein
MKPPDIPEPITIQKNDFFVNCIVRFRGVLALDRNHSRCWTEILEPLLEDGEIVRAVAHIDLNKELRLEDSLAAITSKRFIYIPSLNRTAVPVCFSLSQVSQIVAQDRNGLGTLDIIASDKLLLRLNYTTSRASEISILIRAFNGGATSDYLREETQEETEEKPSLSVLLRLLGFLKPHIAYVALGAVLTLSTTLVSLVPPLLTWPLVDEILAPYQEQFTQSQDKVSSEEIKAEAEDRFKRVPIYLGGMLIAAFVAWALSWGQGYVVARLSERVGASLRVMALAKLQEVSLSYFTRKRTGDLVSRISSDTDRITYFLSDTFMDFVTDVLMLVATVVTLFAVEPFLGLLALLSFPMAAGLTLYTRKRLQDSLLSGYRAWSHMSSVLQDVISGIRVVKAFAQEEREAKRFKAANDAVVRANDKVNKLWTFFWPTVVGLNQVGLIVAWGCGALLVFEQKITLGVLTAFIAYITRFFGRVESMTRMTGALERAACSAKRVFEIFDQSGDVLQARNPAKVERLHGHIEFRDVTFRYGTKLVLEKISFEIRPGEVIGIVGPTGAGKSTIADLLLRFYDPTEGEILVDGINISQFDIATYRRNFGLVQQESFLFFGTVAQNIAYARPSATRWEIVQAAKAAKAHEFILGMPDGYDSMVAERGQTLSGGERQRIAIARAIIANPSILVLDEATSSVDNQTERQIQEALQSLVKGRTTLAVAHRLSTVRDADRIIVIDQGRIVEAGRHDDLLRLGGLYATLWNAQEGNEDKNHAEPSTEASEARYGTI